MNIAWMYLDKRNAVINALKDYESMNYIVDNSPSKICETEEQMIGQSSPSFSDMPKGSPNPKAAENRIVQAIDTITIMNERYQRALEYMTWFQPAWQALSADERFVLSRFYMDDESKQIDSVSEICERFHIERTSAYKKKDRALSRLALLLTLKPYLQAPKKRKLPLKKDDVSKNHAGRDTAAVSEFQPRALSFLR